MGVETKGLGHAFTVIYNNPKDITVYTYGRYDGGYKFTGSLNGSNPIGDGILRKITGEDAQGFVQDELNNKNATFYPITDADSKKTREFYEKKYNSSNIKSKRFPNDGKVVDTYIGPFNTCISYTLNGIEAGGANVPTESKDSSNPAVVTSSTSASPPITPVELKRELEQRGRNGN